MKRILKIVLILIAVILICMTVALFAGYKYLLPYKQTQIDEKIIKAQMECGSTVLYGYDFYDRENRIGKEYVLENFNIESGERFTYVDLDRIPKNMVNAFISIEDKRFYKHHGVDFLRTGRAGINYILKKSSSFGGSTITQQLVKNITGDSEKSVGRKIREIFCSIDLERRYTKDEILCMYLNVINLGNRCRGVMAASQFYFSKDISDLTLAECATIAAITNNPTFYNPVTNLENTRRRRDLILGCMLENSYITESEYSEAVAERIILKISDDQTDKVNSWYTDMVIVDVIDDLVEKYDIDRRAASNMIYHGKLRIYTAMDERIQHILESYYEGLGEKGSKLSGADGIKSSFVLIDIKTGDVLGVAGDIGRKRGSRVQNFATDTKRPSGSAIKPLSVYAPALDRGIIKWSSVYSDSPIEEVEGRAWPQNANKKYVGDVDIEYALANSLNTVSVRVLRQLGLKDSFDFLKDRLNMSSLVEPSSSNIGDMCDSSLALGQHTSGVTLKELTAAYTMFDGGMYKKPRSYFKVTDSEGNILLENEAVVNRAISSESAAIMTKMLQGVIREGTAKNKISLSEQVEVAGKTGTTSNNCDRYFVGYTPRIVAGCWVGYEYPEKINLSGNPAITIWDEVLGRIYALDEYEDTENKFDVPDSITRLSYDKVSGEVPNLYSLDENIKLGWFIK